MTPILFDATTDKVDYGDIAGVAGATALTVALSFWTPSAFVDARNWCGSWDDVNQNAFILVQNGTSGTIGWAVANGSNNLGKQTAANALATNTFYRLCVSWSTTTTMELYLNGSAVTLNSWFSTGTVNSIANSTEPVSLGKTATHNAHFGEYSDFAIWTRALSAAEKTAVTKGWSPLHFRQNLILSSRLGNNSAGGCYDEVGGVAPTLTSIAAGANAHPYIYYPMPQQQMYKLAVVASSVSGPLIGEGHLTGEAILSGGRLAL